MRATLVVMAFCFGASPAIGQIRPSPGPGDPRLQTVSYSADQVVQLEVPVGYQLSIEFAPDERIENVAIGDGGAWQATPNKRGDHLFIKPLSTTVVTNMTVVTDARIYAFELTPAYQPSPNSPFAVRFVYLAKGDDPGVPNAPLGRYRVSGAKALRPSAIADDGEHTYIEWPADSALPAVFAIDETGQETAVDGYMREGQYTIDAVRPKLIFRIDDQTATAERVTRERQK